MRVAIADVPRRVNHGSNTGHWSVHDARGHMVVHLWREATLVTNMCRRVVMPSFSVRACARDAAL